MIERMKRRGLTKEELFMKALEEASLFWKLVTAEDKSKMNHNESRKAVVKRIYEKYVKRITKL